MLPIGYSAALVAASTFAASALLAQESSKSIHPRTPPVAEAAPKKGAVEIDGSLDDSAWRAATPITGLRQYQPTEGAPASLPRTEIRLLYDDEALYIGARMYEPAARAACARRSRAAISCSMATATTDRSIRSRPTSSSSCSIRITIIATRRCSR